MIAIETEFRQFFDIDGSPLDAGFIHIGEPNDNPETSPLAVFWDLAGTQPVVQPIRTLNGYPARNGTPANLFVSGDYSVSVRSKTGQLIYYAKQSANYAAWQKIRADVESVAVSPRSPLIGGDTDDSSLILRSTSGDGTKYPATTTDTVIFQRGNSGDQELGRFSPGGSFGVGDFAKWPAYVVNEHAGDDGTTTRVCSVMAETAALFIGQTTRNNAEGGGPVGRSVVSFEGYRLANDAGSRESGALRVITEGVSANRLGARVSILTRRDGQTDTDFFERFAVHNDGNILHGGGPGAVASANRTGYPSGVTVLTVSGQTGRSAIEQTTNAADGDGVILGDHSWIGNFQTDDKRVAILQGALSGATATKRGGEIRHFLKTDNGALSETLRETPAGIKDAKPYGTLQAAPTLVISGNLITPTTSIVFVGAGLLKNIAIPANFASHGGVITVIPTAAYTTDTTGNIALASVAVVGRAMQFVYDGGANKWYPSY